MIVVAGDYVDKWCVSELRVTTHNCKYFFLFLSYPYWFILMALVLIISLISEAYEVIKA